MGRVNAVTIRRGGAELLDLVRPLWLALHAHHQEIEPGYAYWPDDRSWDLRRGYYQEWITADGSFVLLAERDGEVIGYSFVHVRPGADDGWVTGERIAEVQTLSVAPGERGKGVGTLLLDAVDERLAELGVHDVLIGTLVANTGAQRFYQRRGLRPLYVHLARFGARPD